MKEEHHVLDEKIRFGFWVYLMTDLIMFGALFATYAVLHTSTFGGPDGKELFSMPFVLGETMILLVSSFTCGIAMLSAQHGKKVRALVLLVTTFLLGVSFLAMELTEFTKLVLEGNSWTRSAFLSSFFTLVGTHGLHIASGLLWLTILIVYIAYKGLTDSAVRKLTLFALFWHFLDIVWIFIFTIVYLMA